MGARKERNDFWSKSEYTLPFIVCSPYQRRIPIYWVGLFRGKDSQILLFAMNKGCSVPFVRSKEQEMNNFLRMDPENGNAAPYQMIKEVIKMNVQNLRDNYPKLISYMETNGYSKSYVCRIKREIKKNIQYLTPEEIQKIKKALAGENQLSLCDKAIGMLALYTGLRSCDIAELKLDAIDWDRDIINIILRIPLNPITFSDLSDQSFRFKRSPIPL